MAKDTKPDSYQLHLRPFTDPPAVLPPRQQAELLAAFGDMLLNALTAPKNLATEADDESNTHA